MVEGSCCLKENPSKAEVISVDIKRDTLIKDAQGSAPNVQCTYVIVHDYLKALLTAVRVRV